MKNSILSLLFTFLILVSDYLIIGKFYLAESILFFLLILFITLFLKSYRFIYGILIFSSTIHYLFFSYFHREITSVDIYLFFIHIEDTLESFYAFISLFGLSFLLMLIGLLFLWFISKIKTKPYPLKVWIKYSSFLFFVYINLNSTMSLQFLDALSHLSFEKTTTEQKKESPLYPIRESNLTILLLVGESMKYNNLVESKLKKQKFFYNKIYSGATNTDISLPLLLNAKINPLELTKNNETNLFKLAHKNSFITSFISIQTPKSLQYIKPYLQIEEIDYYKSYSKKERKSDFDFLLLDELNKIDFSQKQFILMQQIGQHSPYKFFNTKASDNPNKNYNKSIEYSFELYKKIYQKLISTKKPFIFIYTSDHGEFTGEGHRYGHNSFDKTIYEVPMFITSNIKLPNGYIEIKSHFHLSQLITYLLGYTKKLELSKAKSIVNGTMLSREDGFRVMP